VVAQALTLSLKYTTRRERPDQSSKDSFPSGHAASTFAFATALERHLGWKYAVPAFAGASYVAASRLPANRPRCWPPPRFWGLKGLIKYLKQLTMSTLTESPAFTPKQEPSRTAPIPHL